MIDKSYVNVLYSLASPGKEKPQILHYWKPPVEIAVTILNGDIDAAWRELIVLI